MWLFFHIGRRLFYRICPQFSLSFMLWVPNNLQLSSCKMRF